MSEPIIPLDIIKREAHEAAERGESLNAACRWPFDTEAGRRFKELFIRRKAYLDSIDALDGEIPL